MSDLGIKNLGGNVMFSWEMLAGPRVTEETHTWTAPTDQELHDFDVWKIEYEKARAKMDQIEEAGGAWFWSAGGYDFEEASVRPPEARWVRK